MILIINICKEKLHYLEFVKPIEDILREKNIEYKTIYYKKITDKELFNKKLEKIIICGTSLKDNEYLKNLEYFKWIKFPKLNKSILGICGGMQIISLIFGGVLIENKEIGLIKIRFEKEFFNFKPSLVEVYLLHNYAVLPNKDFEVFASSGLFRAIGKNNFAKQPSVVGGEVNSFAGHSGGSEGERSAGGRGKPYDKNERSCEQERWRAGQTEKAIHEVARKEFEIPQAIKHKTKEIYGVLFHPEVRNKEMILDFVNL